jgi:hypothetical protein
MTANTLPLKNIRPYGILDHHIHIKCKIERGQHHNTGSCDQETALPNNKDFVHKPCSFYHQPDSKHLKGEKLYQPQT